MNLSTNGFSGNIYQNLDCYFGNPQYFLMSKRKPHPIHSTVFTSTESPYVPATVLDTTCCGKQGSEQRDHGEGCGNLSEDEEKTWTGTTAKQKTKNGQIGA